MIYRPPSGDLDQTLIELSKILDDLPKHSYIEGDFNIYLLQHKIKYIIDFEGVTMNRRFLLLISIITSLHMKNQVARAPVLITL